MLETHSAAPAVQSANEVHVALKSALKSMAEAEQCVVTCFGEILERKLYQELGCSSMRHYAEQELGFSPSRFGHFTRLCEAVLEIMAAFVSQGQHHAGGTTPRGLIPTPGASKPPVQIHIHKCDECAKARVQSSKGELELGTAELAQAECDCQISRPGQRNTTSIPPATRREVLAHYRHKCQRPGCGHTRYLEVHHKIPRSRGGTNDPGNLTCLCSACHKLLHDRKTRGTGFWVKSPKVVYTWGSVRAIVGPYPPAGYTQTTISPTTCCSGYIFTPPGRSTRS